MKPKSEIALSLVQIKAAMDVKDWNKAKSYLDILKRKIKGKAKVDSVLLDKVICKVDELIAERG